MKELDGVLHTSRQVRPSLPSVYVHYPQAYIIRTTVRKDVGLARAVVHRAVHLPPRLQRLHAAPPAAPAREAANGICRRVSPAEWRERDQGVKSLLPAAGGALEREGRGLEADKHDLEAYEAKAHGPALRQLAEPPRAHGPEEEGGGFLLFLLVGGVGGGGAGFFEGGAGQVPVQGGERAVALLYVCWQCW